jgi:hypothetical protein
VPSRHGAPALVVMTPEQEAEFDLIGKFIGIHFLLQRAQRFCGLHQFCCKNSAGVCPGALNQPARLWIGSGAGGSRSVVMILP